MDGEKEAEREVEVSQQKLEEGIQLCVDKAKALANDAKILLQHGGLIDHAAVLYKRKLERAHNELPDECLELTGNAS